MHELVIARLCEVDGCNRPHLAKGLCRRHYKRKRRTGSYEVSRPWGPRPCSEPGCHSPRVLKRLCLEHWMLLRSEKRARCPRRLEAKRDWREKFWERVPVGPGCWEWAGSVSATGYGKFYVDGPRLAHRVAYELTRGPIPDGLQIDHLCRNRRCVNPAHLEAVTQRVNILRGEGPCAKHARKTQCINGHDLSPENLYFYRQANGDHTRVCRTCVRIRNHRRRLAKRGAA